MPQQIRVFGQEPFQQPKANLRSIHRHMPIFGLLNGINPKAEVGERRKRRGRKNDIH